MSHQGISTRILANCQLVLLLCAMCSAGSQEPAASSWLAKYMPQSSCLILNSPRKRPNGTISLNPGPEKVGKRMPDPQHDILVVDDEDAVRDSIASLLRSRDYHVTTA